MADITKYKVTSNRLLVEVYSTKKRTSFGFELNDDSEFTQGTVLAAGAGRKTCDGVVIANEIVAGQRVVWGKGVGIAMKFDGIDAVMINEDDVFGTIEDWLD